MEFLWFGLLVLVLGALVYSRQVAAVTIYEYERGLRFHRGRFDRVLGPGLYRYMPRYTRIQKVDVRPTQVAVPGQEVLSADGVAVKASVAATYRITAPDRAVLETGDFHAAMYAELQLALRSAISALAVEELLARRADISSSLKTQTEEPLRLLGIELQQAALRDITFPGELKKIFTQVVKARQEGLAALERARGETAALRNLANAAQMVQRSPALMQLRLLQVLGQQAGNTVVLGLPNTTAIPLRDAGREPLPPPDASDSTSEA
jgi:regulator of protease activity HflC (stomatin/prohibitin superfamily)